MFGTERSAVTGFAACGLDRMVLARDDDAALFRAMTDPNSLALALCKDLAVLRRVDGDFQPFFPLSELEELGDLKEAVLLGRGNAGAIFGIALRDDVLADPPPGGPHAQETLSGRPDLIAMNVRTLALSGLISPREIGLIGQAKSLLGWHARHRFCSACGSRTSASSAGWRRECANCGSAHFPRTDPVVIMLAVRGDSCLLGRQPRFPKGMYSALAGFLEPGETIENAVRREILEESGIEVGNVSYHASQPWPFPSSLMIGCIGEATSANIIMDKAELEDCRWFHRAELAQMFAAEHPEGLTAPQPIAIAHLLMRDWLDGKFRLSA
jgi:NAD+ diphosphatase